MASHLDAALKAVQYSITSPYRWSTQYQLLKRGFTIDTWDFVSQQDIVGYIGSTPDSMIIAPGKTHFGIMFGDNTGMATSCRYLSEMLIVAGRKTEGDRIRQLGQQLMDRVNQLAWNGKFYTHHIPENPELKRDFGVDQSQQISLSNAYSINRDISHEQAVSIIRSYQNIRQKMPASSPGEWYTIYPPFPRGFDVPQWEYMNGGVTSIVAGELAHGAFEHGFEPYGVDILDRVLQLAHRRNDFLSCVYRGKMPETPQRQCVPLDLRPYANVDFVGENSKTAIGWTGEGNNDLVCPWGFSAFRTSPLR